MPRYRISYKAYYYEHTDYWHEDVEADSPSVALRSFFRERIDSPDALEGYEGEHPETVEDLVPERVGSWWEGDWLLSYRGIGETDLVPCPLCSGSGEIAETQARSLLGGARV